VNRRRFLRLAGAGGAVSLAAVVSHAQSGAETADDLTAEAQAAIQRGLGYLARSQHAAGFWDDGQGPNLAVTGLAALALMAGGHHPGRGVHGRCVSRALDFFLTRSNASPPGYLHGGSDVDNHGQMYEHGFGSLFLAELSGMLPSADRQRRLRDLLEKAIGVTLRSQNKEGGWRYLPRVSDSDVSVTVAQLMALRAAKNAGVYVPKGTVDHAVEYIRACQFSDGGFRYIKGVDAGGSGFARSAAAVVGLYSAGIYDDPAIRRGLRYLQQFQPNARLGNRGDPRIERYYYYGHYYAALAMWTAGGTLWNDWFPAIRDDLLARTRSGPGNVWTDFGHGTSYATAMACIILQLPNNYLPILQK
jgi:hypothetical protein